MPDATATVQQLRHRVAQFVHDRDWEKFHNPKDLALAMNVEAGELLELFQWRSQGEGDLHHPPFREAPEDELAAVFLYCLSPPHASGCDPSHVTLPKPAQNERKHPP